MKLITELNNEISVNEVINEATGKKELFIEGIFAQAEKQNRNGRVYPKSILEREISKYNKEFVSTNRAVGELDHPSGPTINTDRISHVITELKRDGNNFIGKAKILDTPCGNIARGLIEGGVTLGVSTRGLGSLKTVNGVNEVQDDFSLKTVDIVTNPSGPDCFVNGIMESIEYFYENGMLQEKEIEMLEKSGSSFETKLKAFQSVIENLKV